VLALRGGNIISKWTLKVDRKGTWVRMSTSEVGLLNVMTEVTVTAVSRKILDGKCSIRHHQKFSYGY